MNVSEREKRLLVACYEQGNGRDFNFEEAGKVIGYSLDESYDLAVILSQKGIFEALAFGNSGLLTPTGREVARGLMDEQQQAKVARLGWQKIIPANSSHRDPKTEQTKLEEREQLLQKNVTLAESYGLKPESRQPHNPKTGLTNDEELFLIAGKEVSQGVFEVAKAGAVIKYSEERTQFVVANLRKKEILDSRDGGRLAGILIPGQRILDEMYSSGILMLPKYWTAIQECLLKHALVAAGKNNDSFLFEALASPSGMAMREVESVCSALVERRVLQVVGTNYKTRYSFRAEALPIVRAHFEGTPSTEPAQPVAAAKPIQMSQLEGKDLKTVNKSAHERIETVSAWEKPSKADNDQPTPLTTPDPVEASLGPMELLIASIKQNPVNALALGVVGLAAALSIIIGLISDFRVAVFGTILLLLGMGALYLVGLVRQHGSKHARWVVPVFMVFIIVAIVAGFAVLFTAFAFGVPEHAAKLLFERACP